MRTLELEIINENVFTLSKDKAVESLGYSVTVKKGFDFDGASIPKWLWSIYGSPLNGNYVVASLIHDGLYASQKVPKRVSDKIFLDIMKQSNVGYIKRTSMYLAVTLFGGKDWKESSKYKDKYTNYVDVNTNTIVPNHCDKCKEV